MTRRTLTLIAAGLFALGALIGPRALAYDYMDDVPAWPNGNVTLELQLGTSPIYADGTTPNGTAIKALDMWNPYMGRVQLLYVNNSSAAKSATNGKNNVFFSTKVYGTAFGDGVLAVTTGRYTSSRPTEMDVIVNSAESWGSYRGWLDYSKFDLRRVLAHEFGHVLGMDHPDEAGQWVSALMNSHVSDIDTTVQDDQDGIAARYGRGTANPAVAPTITSHPSPMTRIEGQDAYFSVYATGTDPLTYQWLKDGSEIAGATEQYFMLSGVRSTDAGDYSARVSNETGSVTSSAATLTVEAAQLPSFQYGPQSISVEEGASASFSCYASSNAPVTYQWTHDGADIPGATGTSLWLSSVTMNQAGEYSVIATTTAGSVTSATATLTVTPARPPTMNYQLSGGTAELGSSFSFYASVNSTTPVTYQWTHDGVPMPGGTSSSLYLNNVRKEDAGEYRVIVSNAGGTITSDPAQLLIVPVAPPPVIRLTNMTVEEGSSLSIYPWFYPSSGTYTYQWYKNGIPIPSATSSSYYDSSASTADAGEYFVVVTNAGGTTTSTAMIVTVTPSTSTPLGGWKQTMTAGDRVYFLFENPARIERFDLTTDSWLTAISLPRSPYAMAVEAPDSMLVAFARSVARIDAATGAETQLAVLDTDPWELTLDGDALYLIATGSGWGYHRLGRIDLANPGTPVWSETSYYLGCGLSVDPLHGKAFTLSSGISPGDISSTPLNEDGSFGYTQDAPYHGDYPIGTKTTLSPDYARVYDNSGIIYSTENLTFTGSLGRAFDALAFRDDGSPIILRSNTVIGYDSQLRESGSMTLSKMAQALAVFGSNAYFFTQPSGSGSTISWQKRPLSDLAPQTALPAVRAETLDYGPDAVLQDRDGNLLLYSRIHGNIFRWSVAEQRYLDTIPLLGRPNFITYSAELHRVYLGYPNNQITAIDLDPTSAERPFTSAPQQILGLCAVGEHLLLCDPSGAWVAFFTYDRNGALTGRSDWRYFSSSYVWNTNKRRVYHFRDDTSPNDLLYTEIGADGAIGMSKDSPYHGEVPPTPPICISPSGDIILLGSGRFYNADTLQQNNALPHSIARAVWLGTTLYSAHETLDGVQLERWGGSNYGLDATKRLSGRVTGLFACGDDRLVAVTKNGGRTSLTLLDADLNIRNHFEDTPDLTKVVLANLSTRGGVATGDGVMIAGFVVGGTQKKRMLVRGVGPTMGVLGVQDPLPDATLTLMRGSEVVAQNDNWQDTDEEALRQAFTHAGAFELPDGSLDSALIAQLQPGAYTAILSGKNSTQGVGLVEVYDLDVDAASDRLINISTRAMVGVGERVLIPGLVISGTEPKRLLMRAVGPGLSIFGLGGLLADPQLHVIDLKGNVVLSNDDWGKDNPDVTNAAMEAAGGFELTEGSKDAALVATLDPGIYTVIVSGVGDTTGICLVEVYEVP